MAKLASHREAPHVISAMAHHFLCHLCQLSAKLAWPEVVKRLLRRLQQVGLHATVLYLDKRFCSSDILHHLQRIHQAAALACPIRGKDGGLRALCRGRRSYLTDYTFTAGTTARLALVDTRLRDPKTRRKQRKWLAFVLVNLDWTPRQVYNKHRRRFGIEVSYRLLRQVKVLTNSRNPALCFFLIGLGAADVECLGAGALAVHPPSRQRTAQAHPLAAAL
jgi:hypothetical protein